MRISIRNMTYEQMQSYINRISREYDDVYVEVKPRVEGGFDVHIVIRTPEVDVAKII